MRNAAWRVDGIKREKPILAFDRKVAPIPQLVDISRGATEFKYFGV
jgi:hypothetical protein